MERYLIPNLRNACQVLKHLSEATRPKTLREIAKELNLPRTSALRILSTLTLEGFARKQDDRFALGPALISIGSAAKSRLDVGDLAKPILEAVTQQTGETCHLAVPADKRSMIVEVSFSPHPLSSSRGPGAVVELHCSATGKCFLAFAYDRPLDKILSEKDLSAHTATTLTTFEALQAEIERVRQLGYAMDEQEFFQGIRCIAAPVFDGESRCVAGIGITASTSRFTTDLIGRFAGILTEQADHLSRLLGYQGEAVAS